MGLLTLLFFLQYHMRCVSVVRSLYFRIFSLPFFVTFLSIKLCHLLAYISTSLLSQGMMSVYFQGWFYLFALVNNNNNNYYY